MAAEMLPRSLRMLSSTDFRVTIRRGRRIGGTTMVMHTYQPPATPLSVASAVSEQAAEATQVGFVVSKSVGNAVVRNRVKRRLRHLVAASLASFPAVPGGTAIVIRALPPAATRPDLLAGDFERAWRRSSGMQQTPERRPA